MKLISFIHANLLQTCRVSRHLLAAAFFVAVSCVMGPMAVAHRGDSETTPTTPPALESPPTATPTTASPPPEAATAPVDRTGVFVDAAGGRHPWSIGEAHSLLWDATPWIPVGQVFDPSAGTPGLTADAAKAQDSRELDSARAAGLTDILMDVPKGEAGGGSGSAAPPADSPPPSLQALIDSLEARGFRYGLNLHGALTGKSDGYALGEPFTAGKKLDTGTFSAPAPPGVTSALYVARDTGGDAVAMGISLAQDGILSAAVDSKASTVAFINVRQWGPEAGVANLWDSFPDVRDSVLFGLRGIKFGPGLRFFLNPLDGPLTPSGRAALFYPGSPRFHAEYEAWLRRRYPNISALRHRWGLDDDAISDFDAASRLVPDNAVRPDAAWDPDRNALVPIISAITVMWSDFEAFRLESTRHDMDLLAASIRRNIADVPVVYQWRNFSRLYAGSSESDTFDGLSVEMSDVGERAARETPYVLAQVADAPVNWWFLCSGGTGWTAERLNNLTDLGVKGFFLPVPIDTGTPPGPANSDALILLRALRDAIFHPEDAGKAPAKHPDEHPKSSADDSAIHSDYSEYQARILWFPWDQQSTSARRLTDGTWWLPTLRSGGVVPVGPTLQAYQMTEKDVPHLVIWSARGPQTVHMRLPLSAVVAWPTSTHLGRDRGGVRTLSFTDEPVVLTGVGPQDLFPLDPVDHLLAQIDQMRSSMMAERQTRERLSISEETARRMKASGMIYQAYQSIAAEMNQSRRTMLPMIWLEGDRASPNSFNGVARSSQCNDGTYLWLNSADDPPPDKPYSASWTFAVTVPGSYEMWLGGTPPGEDFCSPVTWLFDGHPLHVERRAPGGTLYLPIFHWTSMGEIGLALGRHTLSLTVTGRRIEPDNCYVFAVDAITFTPGDELVKQYLKGPVTTPTHNHGRRPTGPASQVPTEANAAPQIPTDLDMSIPGDGSDDADLKREVEEELKKNPGAP